jgi:ATP-binding cassette subfamily F protein 3
MMFDGENAEKKISVLSGGEKSRVLIAKLLAQPSNVLLLDEPTSHLDVESVEALSDSIGAYAGAVVLVTHSEGLLRELATKLVVFQAGRVDVFQGTYDEFLERKGWEEEVQTDEPSQSMRKDPTSPEKSSLNPKERRALRSQVMAERAKVVGPLKKRVEALEAEIIELEERIELENAELVEASTSGDGARISALARSVAQARSRVDEAFGELENAAADHDKAASGFERQLAELD